MGEATSYLSVKARYPNFIPAIVKCNDTRIQLTKTKFMMAKDANFGTVMLCIRKFITTEKGDAIIFMIDNKIINPNIMVRELEIGNFVYITLMKENTFG